MPGVLAQLMIAQQKRPYQQQQLLTLTLKPPARPLPRLMARQCLPQLSMSPLLFRRMRTLARSLCMTTLGPLLVRAGARPSLPLPMATTSAILMIRSDLQKQQMKTLILKVKMRIILHQRRMARQDMVPSSPLSAAAGKAAIEEREERESRCTAGR